MWKENGEVTRSPEEVKQRWHDHFSDVLNVPSQYRQGTIDELPNHPTEWELDDLQHARSFGCLQKSIFQVRRLSVETKRRVYEATVLSVLLYGADAVYQSRECEAFEWFP